MYSKAMKVEKSTIKRMICAAMFLAACLSVSSAHAASDTGTGKVVVVRPLTFINAQNLEFGDIIVGTTAGTLSVPPTGARTSTGGVTVVSTSSFSPARFAGQGTVGQIVDISVTRTSVNLTRTGGTETMAVDTFVVGSTPTVVLSPTPLNFRIGGTTGIFNFPVGATLRVGANQAQGTYVGSFTISLNYQ